MRIKELNMRHVPVSDPSINQDAVRPNRHVVISIHDDLAEVIINRIWGRPITNINQI